MKKKKEKENMLEMEKKILGGLEWIKWIIVRNFEKKKIKKMEMK